MANTGRPPSPGTVAGSDPLLPSAPSAPPGVRITVNAPVQTTPVAGVHAQPVDAFDEYRAGELGPAASAPRRRGRAGRRILLGVVLVIAAALVYFGVTLAQVWSTGRADARGPADAIVVMGAAQYDGRPSPQLAARLDHVVEIWPNDVAPLIVVTGGNIPGDRFTEAEASAAYLVERGIPESSLMLENDGSSTYESLEGVADMLTERGLGDVVIVTDPYHALRSRLIAEELGLDASVSSTNTSVVTGGDALRRHLEEAAGVAAGRIIGFERLTDIAD